jgi:heat shock protein HslJ
MGKLLLLISLVLACTKENISSENIKDDMYQKQLVGKWKVVSLFLSDAYTGVCHQDKPSRNITFEFENIPNKDNTYQFGGDAPINRYSGSLEFLGFDQKRNIIKIKSSTIGGSKKGGSPEMMDCEQNFYRMLSESTGIQLSEDEPNTIRIGKLREENSHPRDGGTFYILERIN